MSVKRLCDCCGTEIAEDDFMVLKLLPKRQTRGCSLDIPLATPIPNQELCDSCASGVYEHYRLMKANKQGKTLKRVCLNCGQENDYDIVCPICGFSAFKLIEGDTSGA